MVKRRFSVIFLLAVVVSCQEKQAHIDDGTMAFDIESFRTDQFTGRVQQFLQSRPETKNSSDYVAIFVNTEGCSACVKGGFDQLSPYLQHTEARTFIYVNDSSMITSELQNERLQFVWLPTEMYHAKAVFHGDIYLYHVQGRKITPTDLNLQTTDSLNRIAR
jgi:hypothetical protein